jgi:hypothetical protein
MESDSDRQWCEKMAKCARLETSNCRYVDDHKLQGNFTTGQLIVAASIGDEIRGKSDENGTKDGIKVLKSKRKLII